MNSIVKSYFRPSDWRFEYRNNQKILVDIVDEISFVVTFATI